MLGFLPGFCLTCCSFTNSANILLDKNFEARIGDLGQAEQATGCEKGSSSQRHTHITRAQVTSKLYGTKAYQPREVLAGGSLSIKGDVFAMGVVSILYV